MSFRGTARENDISGFVSNTISEIGAIVVKSSKGNGTPKLCQSEKDVLLNFGNPSATYPELFEAVAFCRKAPSWIVSALGDEFAYGGIDIKLASVVPFAAGRDWDTWTYAAPSINTSDAIGTGDGLTSNFTGSLTHYPILPASVKIKVNNVATDAVVSSGGVISGDDVTGTLVLSAGAYNMTFTGTPGTYAYVDSVTSGSANYDLSSGSVNKYINVVIDGVTYPNINLGQSAATTRASVISAINTAVGSVVAATQSTEFIRVRSLIGSASSNVTVTNPTSGASGLTKVFGGILTSTGTDPTGAYPKNGEAITASYTYTGAAITDVSHSFFAASPYTDDLAMSIKFVSGYKFTATLYQVKSTGNFYINTYNYSLIKEKDGFGKSLYYEDVFKNNPYVQIKVNSAFVGTAYVLPGTTVYAFAGGARGNDPSTSDYTTAWANFELVNKYKAKIFMDCNGASATTVKNLVTNYQTWGHAISVVPMGNTAATAITYRSALGINSDKISLYTNWARVQDDYNNSSAWISNVGSIGAKYAQMFDVFDAAAPAGVDENNHGGLMSDWKVLEIENDYTDFDRGLGSELQLLDEAQINPVIFDESYGLMIYGDKTMQTTNSDTSFVGTRRLYNFMIDTIMKQILKKQEFKINDAAHRLKAQTLTTTFIEPIFNGGWIRDFLVVCDESNNDSPVLDAREFVLDVYVKITPTSEFTLLNLIRVSQSQILANLIQGGA